VVLYLEWFSGDVNSDLFQVQVQYSTISVPSETRKKKKFQFGTSSPLNFFVVQSITYPTFTIYRTINHNTEQLFDKIIALYTIYIMILHYTHNMQSPQSCPCDWFRSSFDACAKHCVTSNNILTNTTRSDYR